MLAWNTGAGVSLVGAGAGVVMVEACGVGAGLADVPPGDGRGIPEAGGWLPAHPAHRPSKATANAMLTARTASGAARMR